MCGCIFWPGINKAIEEVVHQCETCTWFQTQNAAAPLTPAPTPSCPWQMCATDILILEELTTSYAVTSTQRWSSSDIFQSEQHCQSHLTAQGNVLRAWNPEVLHSDNGLQYMSAQFADFCTSWGIIHETLSPHYLQLNGFAEACVKSVKHALQCAKYSSANLQLALLALWATPINAKLPSPAKLLYQCWLRTTIPAKICNTDPVALEVRELIATCSDTLKSQADKHCKSLAPLDTGQSVAMYDTLHKIWIPTTVVCVLPKESYQVCTSDGTVYCCMRWHLCKCSVKPTYPVPDATTATLQAPARPCISVPQPAPTKPAQQAQPLPVAPTMPVSPKATNHSSPHHASCPEGHPCIYACDTQCNPCTAQEIRPCLYHTQAPDSRDVPSHGSWEENLILKVPGLCHIVSCTLRHGTIRPMHVLRAGLMC